MPYGKQLRPDSYAKNTLQRYTGSKCHHFERYILLTNFSNYMTRFKKLGKYEEHKGTWHVIHNAKLECTMINIGIGSPMAGMVMHCLGYLDQVDAVIMLGLAGGLAEEMQIGDFVLPTASIRDEGTSRHYLDADVPALPNFKVQHMIAKTAKNMGIQTRSGIFKTTDYRMWEFDNDFSARLREQRVVAIDMEIAALFSVGYSLGKPIGAVMLISDLPMFRSGVKMSDTTKKVLDKYADKHMMLGLKTFERLEKESIFTETAILSYEW